MSAAPADSSDKPLAPSGLAEVRYSLPELLREVQAERNAPTFSTEKLDQVEIAKLFQKNRPRRASRPRK